MPRIRTIKPEFWEDERLGRCEPITRLIYLGLISLADDEGRGNGSTGYITSRIFPYESSNDQRDLVEKSLNILRQLGRVIFYTRDGCTFYSIPKFLHHQKIDRPSRSKLPPPGVIVEDSSNGHGSLDDHSSADSIRDQGSNTNTTTTTTVDNITWEEANKKLKDRRVRISGQSSSPSEDL